MSLNCRHCLSDDENLVGEAASRTLFRLLTSRDGEGFIAVSLEASQKEVLA